MFAHGRPWRPPPLDDGPFQCLDDGGDRKATAWHWLRMDLAAHMLSFCHNNNQLRAILGVTLNNLITDQVQITRHDEDEGGGGGGDRLVVPSAQDDAKRAARARLFGAWGRDVATQEAAIGFAVVASVANTDVYDQSGERRRPCVLNFDAIEIRHRKDAFSQHEWRVYRRVSEQDDPPPPPRLPHCAFDNLFGLRLIPNVLILGADLPDSYGNFNGRVWTLVYSQEWSQFVNKHHLTLVADRKRATPDRLVQKAPTASKRDTDPDLTQPMTEEEEAQMHVDQIIRTGRRVGYLNQLTPDQRCAEAELEKMRDQHGHTNHGQRGEAQRELAAKHLVLLEPDQEYVSGDHMPEAPQELATARQAFWESVCLAFGVPMSMLSSGDASGRSRLNSETASPETAQIFRDAQTSRKRRLEDNIRQAYHFMYAAEDTRSYIRFVMEERLKRVESELKQKGKKRKAAVVDEDDDDETVWVEHLTHSDDEALSERALERVMRVRVKVPDIQQTDEIYRLLETGMLTYQAACHAFSRRLGIDLACFNPKQAHTEGQQLVYGTKPKPEPAAGGGGSKPKKKAKTK